MKPLFFSLFLAVLPTASLFCQEPFFVHYKPQDSIAITSYSHYSDLPFLNSPRDNYIEDKKFDSIIKSSMNLIGLSMNRIQIVSNFEYPATSAFNMFTYENFFFYNPLFLDFVYQKTGSYYSLYSICFHELGHIFMGHALEPKDKSHYCEEQADLYSGYQMAIIGASLDQSLQAVNLVGDSISTPSHPDKFQRMKSIKLGYYNAKINLFKDTNYRISDLYPVTFHANINHSEIQIDKETYSKKKSKAYKSKADTEKIEQSNNHSTPKDYETYSLFNDLIYLTKNNDVVLLQSNKTIGKVIKNGTYPNSVELNFKGIIFIIENNTIYSVLPNKDKMEVGRKIK